LESSLAKTERTYIRLIVGGGAAIVLLVVVGWLAFHGYQRWEVRHLLRRSAAYLSGGDVRTASLSARRAFQIDPSSVEAARAMAVIAERSGDRSELEWRRKVLELGGAANEDKFALIEAALRIGDFPTAEKTLATLSLKAKNSAEYESSVGRLEEMRNNHLAAEAHWSKAVELAPDDPAYQMQLASLRLTMKDEAKRASAHAILEHLRNNEKQRASATRALIIDGANHGEQPMVLRVLANDLQGYPEATFSDRLLFLDLLNQLRDPDFADYFAKVKKAAANKPSDLPSLFSWMNNSQRSSDAIAFSRELPKDAVGQWPVAQTIADSYAKTGDWEGLERFAKEGNWGAYDFLRHAYLARSFRFQEKQVAADQEWRAAQKQDAGQPQAILALARAASSWGWKDETVDLLWNLSRQSEASAIALQELYHHYANAGDTAGLYRVLVRNLEISPNDPALQNNLAQISLLLDADPERARKLASDLEKKEPNNPAFASTFAFSLYKKGDVTAALEVMNKLTEIQRREPAIAAYYGIILAGAGEKEKAREYLKLGQEAKLLPEEKSLVEKATHAAE
jgi:predicted Zn-dependent protease